jgi:hypothetical protein
MGVGHAASLAFVFPFPPPAHALVWQRVSGGLQPALKVLADDRCQRCAAGGGFGLQDGFYSRLLRFPTVSSISTPRAARYSMTALRSIFAIGVPNSTWY